MSVEEKAAEFDRLMKELKELGLMRECCLGCGAFTDDRDCGCPAGTGWCIDKRKIVK